MTSEREDVIHVISLFGELDVATAGEVRGELERAEASDAASIVLDLSGLTFMDSTGIRLLIEARDRSRSDRNRLTLLRGPASVQRVLQIAGVDDVLPFAD
ncbi:MAG: anti-sigma factor antagonist [Solirubrobacteraceae bacterium]|nr:anti-sigma factor antagonist [Solirubrobacteraceae bacterium]